MILETLNGVLLGLISSPFTRPNLYSVLTNTVYVFLSSILRWRHIQTLQDIVC